MASRRTRIKGIANIPPRKKPTPIEENSMESKIKLDQGSNEAKSGKSSRELEHEETGDLSNKDKLIGNSSETQASDCKFNTNYDKIQSDPELVYSVDDLNIPSSDTNEKPLNNDLQNSNTTTENKLNEPALVRRKFLKPKVNLKFENNNRNVATESKPTEEIPIIEPIPSLSNLQSKSKDLNEYSSTATMTETETALMPTEPADAKPVVRRKFLKPKVNLNFKTTKKNVGVVETEISNETPAVTSEYPNPSIQMKKGYSNDHLDNTTTENETATISVGVKPGTESNIVEVPKITEVSGPSEVESKLDELHDDSTEKKTNEPSELKPIVRRKFLKPKVNLNFKNINRNVADGSKEISTTEEIPRFTKTDSNPLNDQNESAGRQKVIVLSEIRILSNKAAQLNSETANSATMPNADLMSNETQFDSNEISQKKSASVIFPLHKRYISESQASDSEYPAPPPSPSKINRSRIKAVPKLSFRKASCSASESEDETRKYGRIRNNSVCSVASTSTYLEPATPTLESVPLKETPMPPKKLVKTEQSKKLAEAKRDFQRRFGAKPPEKHKLRMIDLIYYNPETNPMSQQKSNESKSETNEKETEEVNDEEQVDDPIEQQKENDTDNMPVPQIKIGPSGEIILDEQSLIVENAEIAKRKEEILNSSVVDGDFDTGYGIYKRAQRTVNWTKKETLRFYKALNLIGTDFTTMTELFPRRTRRELKLKFKKEERTNRHLIDKAILEPCSYNYTDFKREMQTEEEEEAFLIKLRNEESERRKQRKMENLKEKAAKKEKKMKSKGTSEDSNEISEPETQAKKCKAKRKRKCLTINSTEDSDEDGDISDTIHSDTDEEEIIPFLKPTRSGRIPKGTIKFTDPPEEVYRLPKKKFYKKLDGNELKASLEAETTVTNSHVTMLNHAARNRRLSSSSSVESNSDRLVPGSVVITTEEGPDNESEYKVFMVTPDKKMVPLQLDSSIIERLIKERQSAEFPLNTEKNVTIPSNEANFIIKGNGDILEQ
ncbi:unnamed protein product [Ceutorhynchus assimilis]|uniref:Myb-like domain-containing protein n=1 Tax=Ceutorhynchus assimilis TaxID=467358 RepID=A0A9N9MGS8_9CUCU|nr:unnamed protein product [Ceutorhynchus assimilis]